MQDGRVGFYPDPPCVRRRRNLFRDLDAPVPRPAFLRPVVGDRLGLPPTLRRDPRRRDPLCLHVIGGGVGPPLGQPLVVRVGADRVGMALDERADLGVLLHWPHDLRIDALLARGLQCRLVEVEVRVGRELDALRRRRRRRRWWWWWRRGWRFLRGIADQVAEERSDAPSNNRATSCCLAGVLAGAVLLVRIDEPPRSAGADGGSDESAGDRTVTPSPLPHGAAATQDEDCGEPERSHSLVTHAAPPRLAADGA